MESLFGHLKVLELASVLAGPAAGQFFAELGADVVKVEPPGQGDVTRTWRKPGETHEISAYFSCVNWGKRSIMLDLENNKDQRMLARLIEQADVLISSTRPGASQRLGIDYPGVRAINPAILFGQITGYGHGNERMGYDAVIQAESGFMYLNSEPSGTPQKMPVALIDIIAAHHLKEALLVALIRRMQTGEGACVSVSLLDAAIASLANQGANYLVGGKDPAPSGSLHPNIAPYGEVFQSSDNRRMLLAVGSDRQFTALVTMLGAGGLAKDQRFADNISRVRNRHQLYDILREKIGCISMKDLLEKCHLAQVPAGEIRTTGTALDDYQENIFEANGLRGIRTFIASGLPVSPTLTPPPPLDHDRENILSDWIG